MTNDTQWKRKDKAKKLKEALKADRPVTVERKFCVSIPDTSMHQFHDQQTVNKSNVDEDFFDMKPIVWKSNVPSYYFCQNCIFPLCQTPNL